MNRTAENVALVAAGRDFVELYYNFVEHACSFVEDAQLFVEDAVKFVEVAYAKQKGYRLGILFLWNH